MRVLKIPDSDYEGYLGESGVLSFLALNKLISKEFVLQEINSMEIPEKDLENLIEGKYRPLGKKEILNYIDRVPTISQSLFTLLNRDVGYINTQHIIDYYMLGKISYEMTESLSQEPKAEISSRLTVERLIQLYLDYRNSESENEENENNTSELKAKEVAYNRYINLFRNYKLRELDTNSKQNIENEILDLLGEYLDEKSLKDLYQANILTFETLRGWVNFGEIIVPMMLENKIRPQDVQDSCIAGDYRLLIAALENPYTSKSVKMGIYRTTFANIRYEELTEEEKENIIAAQKKAIPLIGLTNERRYQTTGERRMRQQGEKSTKKNNTPSNPMLRWDLLAMMGTYSCEILDSGMCIFKFPYYKGGTIILEKMYRKDVPEYGRATKIIRMPIEEFERIKDYLIIDGDIRPNILDLCADIQGKKFSMNHTTTWGQRIADYFEYDLEGNRSAEEIDRINRIIEEIHISREFQGRD